MENTKIEHDVLTGKIVVRELTADELAQQIKDKKNYEQFAKDEAKAKAKNVAARESALAKLAALGLTEAEIAAL